MAEVYCLLRQMKYQYFLSGMRKMQRKFFYESQVSVDFREKLSNSVSSVFRADKGNIGTGWL
jgi:hypothetical protein